MTRCKKCGNSLSSNGYCHICLSYDLSTPDYDLPTPEAHIYEKKCPVCHQYFSNVSLHMESQHSHCSLCSIWFLDKNAFTEHLLKHPKCEYCQRLFDVDTSEASLQIHKRNHKCSICHQYFSNISLHMESQHSRCSVCKEWFLDEKACIEHLLKHPICTYCNKRFKSKKYLAKHKEVHKRPVCHQYFSNVTLHVEKEHPHRVYSKKLKVWCINNDVLSNFEKEYLRLLRCSICGRQLYSIQGINAHIRDRHKIDSNITLNSSILEHIKNGQVFFDNQQNV